MFPLVFQTGGKAAAQMAFSLVKIQKLPNLAVEPRVEPGQTLRQILMYRGLGDAEDSGRRADGRPMVNDICGQVAGPLLDVGLHSHHSLCAASPRISCSIYMRGREGI